MIGGILSKGVDEMTNLEEHCKIVKNQLEDVQKV